MKHPTTLDSLRSALHRHEQAMARLRPCCAPVDRDVHFKWVAHYVEVQRLTYEILHFGQCGCRP